MTTRINDGGQAFPSHPILYSSADQHEAQGMSLRDWFAAHYQFDQEGISRLWAEAVMGGKAPEWTTEDHRHCIKWWLEAEATIRFMSADAMLAARKGGAA